MSAFRWWMGHSPSLETNTVSLLSSKHPASTNFSPGLSLLLAISIRKVLRKVFRFVLFSGFEIKLFHFFGTGVAGPYILTS